MGCRLIHAVVEVFESALALLGLVHREVGLAQQGIGILAIVRIDADADAGADRVAPLLELERLGKRHGEFLRHPCRGPGRRRMADDDGELVAAQAGDEVVGTQLVVEAAGDDAQYLVAHLVPLRVVDVLEAVEVDEQQRHLVAVALSTRQRMAEKILEIRPVGQAGERIMVGQHVEPHLGIAPLGQRRRDEEPPQRQGDEADLQGQHFSRLVDAGDAACRRDDDRDDDHP